MHKCVLYWICLIPGFALVYALYHLVCVPTLVALARAAAALMGLSCRELRRSLCWNFAPAWSRSIIILCINTRMLPASIIVIRRIRNYHFAYSNLPTGFDHDSEAKTRPQSSSSLGIPEDSTMRNIKVGFLSLYPSHGSTPNWHAFLIKSDPAYHFQCIYM